MSKAHGSKLSLRVLDLDKPMESRHAIPHIFMQIHFIWRFKAISTWFNMIISNFTSEIFYWTWPFIFFPVNSFSDLLHIYTPVCKLSRHHDNNFLFLGIHVQTLFNLF